jgi:small Trp-rich protein
MWLIWVGVVWMGLHFAGVGWFGTADYWWLLPFGLALAWFELIERPFGLDRKKGHDEMDETKRRRIRTALGDRAESVQRKIRGRR